MSADIAEILKGRKEGLFPDMPEDEYRHGHVALSPSTIVFGQKSMLHLKHRWDTPWKDTDDLLFGRAVHCMCLEPREFGKRYTYWDGRRAGNAYKGFSAEADENGQEVLTAKQWEWAQLAALALAGNAQVQDRVAAGRAEVSVFWVEDGVQCSGRIDWLSSGHEIVDIKTTKNILARPFGRDFYQYGYDVKLGLYRHAIERVTGEQCPVDVLCVEKEPPFDATAVPVPPAVLDRGAEKGLEIVRRVKQCIEADVWPGVACGKDYYLDVPVWEMEEESVKWGEYDPLAQAA